MARAIANPTVQDPVRSWLHVADNDVARALVERVSMLVGASPSHCESPEIIYYRQGARRGLVTELLNPDEPAVRDFYDHGGQRVLTALVFLQDHYSGAGDHELDFLQPGTERPAAVRAPPGRCVFFANQNAAGQPAMYAVASQTSDRWVAVLRFREGRFHME